MSKDSNLKQIELLELFEQFLFSEDKEPFFQIASSILENLDANSQIEAAKLLLTEEHATYIRPLLKMLEENSVVFIFKDFLSEQALVPIKKLYR